MKRPPLSLSAWISGTILLAAVPALAAAEQGPLPSRTQAAGATTHHLTPVAFFRALLGMSAEERERALARKSPADREVILAKLQEYELLPKAVREARLCQTELHWELSDLMKMEPSGRAARMGEVSVLYRPLVEGILQKWDQLPAETRKTLLERQSFIGLYLRLQGSPESVQREILARMAPERRTQWTNEMSRWQALPERQREDLCAQFQRFCSLNGPEQSVTITPLTKEERAEMDRVLETFNRLPQMQRTLCINSFRKFATMSADERSQFLKNAERWDAMTSHERELWRELVQTLPPMPPMPPGFGRELPPMPPTPPGELSGPPPLPPMPPNVSLPVVVAAGTNDFR